MDLGFKESFESDSVFFNEFGYDYTIISKKLHKGIIVYWEKSTQLCELIRHKKGIVKNRFEIKTLEQLKEIINFFENK